MDIGICIYVEYVIPFDVLSSGHSQNLDTGKHCKYKQSTVSILPLWSICFDFFGVNEACGVNKLDGDRVVCARDSCILSSHLLANCTWHTSQVTESVLGLDGVCKLVAWFCDLSTDGVLYDRFLCVLSSHFVDNCKIHSSHTKVLHGAAFCPETGGNGSSAGNSVKCLYIQEYEMPIVHQY